MVNYSGTIQTKLLINNKWVDAASKKTFPAYNPATKEIIAQVAEADKADVDLAVKAAREAFKTWGKTSGYERSKLMHKLADLIERDADGLARLETLNNGKPYETHSKAADLPLTIQCIRYYAGWADKLEGKQIPVAGNFLTMTYHEPIGVVGQIIPWNFPLLMLAWKFGPALAAGCTIVMKPAEQTPLTALKIGELCIEAGFPPGVVNMLPGYGPTAGGSLTKHMDVDKVAFTGSGEVGRLILQAAAESNMKNVTLELGGKSPLVIFPDADLDKAAVAANTGVFFNAGQVCCASSRVFVHESIHDEFIKKAVAHAKTLKVGDPFEKDTFQGPQVDEQQYNKILEYIEHGHKEGAKLACGGKAIGTKGWFIEPTIFTDVNDKMKIHNEEIFGPFMSVMKFKTTEEVIEKANFSEYGLAAGVFTSNVANAINISKKLRAGTVWVNCWNVFDAAQPFGGYKQSGMGRELGEYGLRNYLEVKSVCINLAQ